MFVNSEVISSLDEHCKHQIIQENLNFSVPCQPPYKRKVWKYHLAITDMIKQSLILIDWNILLQNKTTEEMVLCFTETFLKIMDTYVPHHSVTVNDKDTP